MFAGTAAQVKLIAFLGVVGALSILAYELYVISGGGRERVEEAEDLFAGSASVYEYRQPLFPVRVNYTDGYTVFDGVFPVPGVVNVVTPQYVSCPDICHFESLVLQYLRAKLAQEGLADRVVFVTVEVDPWGTSLEAVQGYMRPWLTVEGPTWLWIVSDEDVLRRVWLELGVAASQDPETGLVSHTAGFYIVDDRGVLLYLVEPVWDSANFEAAPGIAQGLYALISQLARGEQAP